MTVAIGIIALLAGLIVPTFTAAFRSGADEQAYNLVFAQLLMARAAAVRGGTYAGVHFQLADEDDYEDLEDVCFCAVVWDDPADPAGTAPDAAHRMTLHPDATVQRLPGDMVVGKIDASTTHDNGKYKALSDSDLADFTTFTVVFSPAGKVTRKIRGQNIKMADDGPFSNGGVFDRSTANDGGAGRLGQNALTLFNIRDLLDGRPGAGDRADYLNANAMVLAVNVHTGQLFPRD
jgi:type II secretory pathway pseudopilin PulG